MAASRATLQDRHPLETLWTTGDWGKLFEVLIRHLKTRRRSWLAEILSSIKAEESREGAVDPFPEIELGFSADSQGLLLASGVSSALPIRLNQFL